MIGRPWRRFLTLAVVLVLIGSLVPGPGLIQITRASVPATGLPLAQAAGEPVVITGTERVSRATPSGEQLFRMAGGIDDPVSLDPALARDLGTAFLVRQLFRGLTRLDDELSVEPELAERIEISPDGRIYTFTLRPEITFHNGDPITAEDVVFSLTRVLTPATAGGNAALLAGPTYLSDIVGAAEVLSGASQTLAGVRALDERTVEIELTEPNASFLTKLASPAVAVVDANDVSRADWWRSPNGSGPFRITEWTPGERLLFGRHEGFFAGPPPLAELSILLGPNASQPFNLYQADVIDTTNVPILSAERALNPDGELAAEVTVAPVLATGFLALRSDVEPLDDPHVRRAIQLAFPRHRIAEVTFNGLIAPADGLVPPGMLGREWPVAAAPYDLEAAREELALSRYGSAAAVPPIEIFTAGSVGSSALRDVLEADLGLQVDVIQIDWAEFNVGLTRRGYPAYELLWGADYPDPETFLWSLFGSDSPDNYSDYANPEYDALLADAALTLDEADRAVLYDQAQQVLAGDNVLIPLYHETRYTLAKPAVHGLTVTPLGILYLDDVWMEQ
ncbi:MAG: peptide ABC transporter substrate-binding protein [Chloroflexota bacterium]|nr:peptide ABC transporter substrate-binding protein [Chloroflexota bacterium]